MPQLPGTQEHLIEFDLYIAPDGTEYDLNDGATAFLMGQGGLGMPPIVYRSEQGPLQHGVTPTDYRLQPRMVQMLIRINGEERADFWDNRASILDALRPNRQQANTFAVGKLRKIYPIEGNPDEIRDLDVLIEQGPQFGMKDPTIWDEWGFTEVLRFIAFNPIFYNPTQKTVSVNTDVGITELVFPITFPIQFGESFIDVTTQLNYLGNWLEYPVIEIVGPLDAPRFYNDTTDEVIEVNYNIQAGETLTINLSDRLKTVRSSLDPTLDLQGVISTESDLGTWHIGVDPEAPLGVNDIRVVASGANPEVTQIRIKYYDRYIGI